MTETHYGPTQVPTIRRTLLQNGVRAAHALGSALENGTAPPRADWSLLDDMIQCAYLLARPDTQNFYLSEQLVELLEISASTYPISDVVIDLEQVPAPAGFVWLERSVLCSMDDGTSRSMYGFGWMISTLDPHADLNDLTNCDGVETYWVLDTAPGQTLARGASLQLGAPQLHDVLAYSYNAEDVKRLCAFFALVASPGITETAPAHFTRQQYRDAARKNQPRPEVNVIRLRHHQRGPSTPTGRHQTVRYIVRGHWRQQPYGPGRALRKAVWIAPHIRGPEDAELIVTDKVIAL